MSPLLSIAFCLLVSSEALADSIRAFDKYIDLSFSDEKARLDNLAIQLQQEPGAVGWYVIYTKMGACIEEARLRARRAKKYLVENRGIPADRITWMDGGYQEDVTVELWIMPRSLGNPHSYSSVLGREVADIIKECKPKDLRRRRRKLIGGVRTSSTDSEPGAVATDSTSTSDTWQIKPTPAR